MVKRIAQSSARTRAALATAGIALLATPAAALAFGEGRPIDGGERNPSQNASREYRGETEIIARNATYGTRQSNKSNSGGGAIYGCRARVGTRPCLRANNLNKGLAFTFQTSGMLGGQITSSQGGDRSKPFTTNATGVATGLNADRVDGLQGNDIVAKNELLFAVVGGDAKIANKRGATGASRNLPSNSYIVAFNKDVSNCSFSASKTGNALESDRPLAVAGAPGDAKAVRVDAAGGQPVGFHLQVVC